MDLVAILIVTVIALIYSAATILTLYLFMKRSKEIEVDFPSQCDKFIVEEGSQHPDYKYFSFKNNILSLAFRTNFYPLKNLVVLPKTQTKTEFMLYIYLHEVAHSIQKFQNISIVRRMKKSENFYVIYKLLIFPLVVVMAYFQYSSQYHVAAWINISLSIVVVFATTYYAKILLLFHGLEVDANDRVRKYIGENHKSEPRIFDSYMIANQINSAVVKAIEVIGILVLWAAPIVGNV